MKKMNKYLGWRGCGIKNIIIHRIIIQTQMFEFIFGVFDVPNKVRIADKLSHKNKPRIAIKG